METSTSGAPSGTGSGSSLGKEAQAHLPDCSRILLFDAAGSVLFASCAVLPGEAKQLAACFDDREAAVQSGLRLEGRRYEVHRHHPPLVFGRSMADCEPETSTGIAVCRMDRPSGGAAFIAVTYEQPHTSARVVPRVQDFAQKHLAAA
ncbi:hypothetical protein C2E20_0124 [Micractinium conductrix]|uniref:Profilin n=1 Tax=Micractinium conductrix TaxID=554055 RepID=A0A2P6VQJ9_9CHLO|nr:hypothetical protein C2E20_0124 [Micractinium conductrix]PSC76345.1 hypothetical protein C2E20_0124 [Micractinium conductrix]|eukprot:PSC76344.1 hypothetical protein C2E20_0124 [Micractinium conductrix]